MATQSSDVHSEVMGVGTAWLQRYEDADIWRKYVTFIPLDLMTKLSDMQYMFVRFLEAKNLNMPQMRWLKADTRRFLRALLPVLEFIRSNTEMFEKPSIAFLQQDDKYAWSVFISVNASLLEPEGKETSSGFVLYNSQTKEAPAQAPQECSLFLLLSYSVLKQHKGIPDIAEMDHFLAAIQMSPSLFGYEPFCEKAYAAGFPVLHLPSSYPVLRTKETQHLTGIQALMFLLDFWISPVTKKPTDMIISEGGKLTLSGLGKCFPKTTKEMTSLNLNMVDCVYQIIDRISAQHLTNEVRKSLPEFAFLGKTKKELNNALTLKDHVGGSWKELSRTVPETTSKDDATNPMKTNSTNATTTLDVGVGTTQSASLTPSPGSDDVSSQQRLEPIVAMFEKEFGNAASEDEKEIVVHQALMMGLLAHPIPAVTQMMEKMRSMLQNRTSNTKVASEDIGDHHICEGRKSDELMKCVLRYLEKYQTTTKEGKETSSSR